MRFVLSFVLLSLFAVVFIFCACVSVFLFIIWFVVVVFVVDLFVRLMICFFVVVLFGCCPFLCVYVFLVFVD